MEGKDEKIEYFLCSEKAVKILKPENVSRGLKKYDGQNHIAVLKFEEVEAVYNSLSDDEKDGFYVQEIIEGQISADEYDPNEFDLFHYINVELGFCKPENECYFIYNLAKNEGLTPIDLFNKLYCFE